MILVSSKSSPLSTSCSRNVFKDKHLARNVVGKSNYGNCSKSMLEMTLVELKKEMKKKAWKMRKFIINEGKYNELTGTLITMQLTPVIKMIREDLEYYLEQYNELHVIYIDESGEIWTKKINESDNIKLL